MGGSFLMKPSVSDDGLCSVSATVYNSAFSEILLTLVLSKLSNTLDI